MQSLRSAGYLVLGFLLAAGCSGKKKDEGPVTYLVTGKVVHADGKPYARGAIEFRSTTDANIRAFGRIKDGTFSLRTSVTRGDPKPGAEAGHYQVSIMPDQGTQQDGPPPMEFTLPGIFTVEEKDNTFTISIPKS